MGVLRKATVKESVKITDSDSNKGSDSNDYTDTVNDDGG